MVRIFRKKTEIEQIKISAEKGNFVKIEELVNNSESPTMANQIAFNSLIKAKQYTESSKYLDKISQFNTDKEDPHRMIRIAADISKSGDTDLAKKIISKLNNLNDFDLGNRNALSTAIKLDLDDSILENITNKTNNFDVVDNGGNTALSIAISAGKEKLALNIIEKTNNVSSIDQQGYTPLLIAIQSQQENVAFKILEKLDNIDHKNDFDQDALYLASLYSSKKLLEALKEKNTPAITKQATEALKPVFKGILSKPEDAAQLSKFLKVVANNLDNKLSKQQKPKTLGK